MAPKEQINVLSNGLLIRAPAKINLSLLIAGKRDDGFHEIETVMAKVDLFDEILIEQARTHGIEIVCQGPHWAPQGKENIIYKACEMLMAHCRFQADIKLTLAKNIPAGSGLGSASSDAAATLIGVRKFLNLPVAFRQLTEMAASLGSDVPFFLDGPLAICRGKGEKIEKLEKNFDFLTLLVLPDVSVSTKEVYDDYEDDKALYENLHQQINGLLGENRIDLVAKVCANMLQKSCFQLHRELAQLKAEIESLGMGPLCLSGSGSAMFALLDSADEKTAKEYQRKLNRLLGCKSILVSNNRW